MRKPVEKNQALSLVPKLPLELDVWAFLTDCQARNLSHNTLRIYRNNLLPFQRWLTGVSDVPSVTPNHIRRFLVHLQERHNPGGLHQTYRVLKTFFRWLVAEGVIDADPVARVKAPRLPQQQLQPTPLSDLKAMLATCERRTFLGDRDRAILLALLDTGCRASEFVHLNLGDVNLRTGAVIVRRAKGGKFRTAFVGAKTRREAVRYLRHRKDAEANDALWVTLAGSRLSYWGLRQVIRRRAEAAEVAVPSLHSFRRAFALICLRGGMDIYSLQKLMGHADLSVLQHYLRLTEADLRAAHERAGPVIRCYEVAVTAYHRYQPFSFSLSVSSPWVYPHQVCSSSSAPRAQRSCASDYGLRSGEHQQHEQRSAVHYSYCLDFRC